MAVTANKILSHDPVWSAIRQEATEVAAQEPLLGSLVHSAVLHHQRLEDALSYILAQKLGNDALPALGLREVMEEAFEADPDIGNAVRADLVAVNERDPACRGFLKPLLFFKGFRPFRPIVSPTGCGTRTATPWPCCCRAGLLNCLPSTFILRRASAAAS